jgi:hypothetical protein
MVVGVVGYLLLYDLDATVLGLTLFRTIIRNWLLLPLAECRQSGCGDPLLDNGAHDRFGPLRGKSLVVLRGSYVVGVALNAYLKLRMSFEKRCDLFDNRH